MRTALCEYDPLTVAHSRVIPGRPGTATVRADLRSPEPIIGSPRGPGFIDFGQPCGLPMMSALHFVSGDVTPLVAAYTRRLAHGSCLALSHVVTDGADPGDVSGAAEVYQKSPADPRVRSTAAVRELFHGFELLPPGLTDVRRLGEQRQGGERVVAQWQNSGHDAPATPRVVDNVILQAARSAG